MVSVLIGILFTFSSPTLLRGLRLIARGGVLACGILVIGGGGAVDGFNALHTGKKAQVFDELRVMLSDLITHQFAVLFWSEDTFLGRVGILPIEAFQLG